MQAREIVVMGGEGRGVDRERARGLKRRRPGTVSARLAIAALSAMSTSSATRRQDSGVWRGLARRSFE